MTARTAPSEANHAQIAALRTRLEADLSSDLQPPDPTEARSVSFAVVKQAPQLLEAMRYATMAGGKRLRPLLCMATAVAVGGALEQASHAARALEYMHTYSLIHDDLPAMDDDSLRRGKPTCHIVFGEADAILAGDALQALAFETLSKQPAPAEVCLAMLKVLSEASGWAGMVGGQSLDLALTGQEGVTQSQLETLHAAKTGALLGASLMLGALAAQPKDAQLLSLSGRVGALLGLAFQVIDDVLDVSQTTQQLGKDAGSDAEQGKTTFVDLLGLEGARHYAHDLYDQSIQLMEQLPGDTTLLSTVAWDVVFRDR